MRRNLFVITICLLVLPASAALADPVTPVFTYFGSLPEATFGGSGIPSGAVAVTTIHDGDVTWTLGLSTHGRYDNPDPTNHGRGSSMPSREPTLWAPLPAVLWVPRGTSISS